MRRLIDRATDLAMVVMIVLVAYMAWRPGSPLRLRWDDWSQARATRRLLRTEWPRLAATGSRLDSGHAAVELVEFADYQCPFCRQSSAVIDTVVGRGNISMSYIHLPLSIHPAATGAARAAICAEELGRFPAMHHRLMTTDKWQRDSDWVREAVAAGITQRAQFVSCLRSPSTTRRLERDMAAAKRMGVTGTPTFFTREMSHVGTASPADFEKLVRESR